jgi:hypothetical protein
MGNPQARWLVYIMENPKMDDDLGVPPFQETSIYTLW